MIFTDDDPFKTAKKKPKTHSKEVDMTEAIVAKLNALTYPNVICQKIKASPYGKPTLDIVGSRAGLFFWLEVKQPGQKPTKRQQSTMRNWIKKDAVATWTTSVEGAISFINSNWLTLTDQKMMEGFHD